VKNFNTLTIDRLLGVGAAVIDFPRQKIIKMLASKRAGEIIKTRELSSSASDSGLEIYLDEVIGILPEYRHLERFQFEMQHQMDLIGKVYSRDSRLFQRLVGEHVGGSLTRLLEEERSEHRNFFQTRSTEVNQRLGDITKQMIIQHGIGGAICYLDELQEKLSEKIRDLRERQQQLNTELENQQATGQRFLTEINELIRGYHWLPSLLLSSNIIFRFSILIGMLILGIVTGSFWGVLGIIIFGISSAIAPAWLLFIRKLPSTSVIEPIFRGYYLSFGKRIFLDEQLAFINRCSNRVNADHQRLNSLLEDLRQQSISLNQNWQNNQQQIVSPPRHITCLLREDELEKWYQELVSHQSSYNLEQFRMLCFEMDSMQAVNYLIDQIQQSWEGELEWTAEERVFQLHGNDSMDFLMGNEASVLKGVFTLAIRSGRLLHPNQYHQSFIIGIYQADKSKLAMELKHHLKKHNLGGKFVENGDPYKISILGIEGGFTIHSLREASELMENYQLHRSDPLIYPQIRRRKK
jgi:hypothetical protein